MPLAASVLKGEPGIFDKPRIRHSRVLLAVVVAVIALVQPGSEIVSTDGGSSGQITRASVDRRCGSDGEYVWSHQAACGWPSRANAGPDLAACTGNRLSVRDGSPSRVIRVRRTGSVVACEDITGCLSIEARDVTMRDVRIRCTSGRRGEAANGTAVISIADGADATIRRTAINGMRGVHACIWHQGLRMTVTAVNCRGVDDGVFSWADLGYSRTTGDHFTIKDSYFHDFTTRTANGHVDGYQTEGAAHGLIEHNTFLMTSDSDNSSNSAVAIWDELRNSHDITVRDNLISGGGFSVYAHDYSPSDANPAGGFSVKRTYFIDNVFSKHLFGCVGFYGVWFPRGRPTDGWHRDGNRVLETRAPVDNRNPVSGGHPCT